MGVELYLLSGEPGFPLDDSWIHLQFARNVGRGAGLSINPGELVPGSTAPLWTALVSILFLLPGSPLIWVQLLGVVLFVATVLAAYALALELAAGEGPALLAGLLTAGTGWLVWSALSGMEILLFSLLGLGGMLLHLRERRRPSRPPLSLAVLGLAILVRPEAALLLLLAVLDRGLRFAPGEAGGLRWRPAGGTPLWAGLGLALLPLAPVLLFNSLVGGSPLPTTFAAKAGAGVGPARLLPDLRFLHDAPLGVFFSSQPYMTLLAGAGVVILLRRLGGDRDRGLLPALWLLGLPLAYALLSARSGVAVAGNFGRYFFPLLPLVVVLGSLGLAEAWSSPLFRRSAGRWGRPLAALALLVILWPSVTGLVRGAGRYAQSVSNVHDSDVRIARWLAPRLDPAALVAVNDIGALAYLLPNRVLDLAGIAHPEIRADLRRAAAQGASRGAGVRAFLERHRPDYLVIFPSWYPSLLRPDSGFEPIYAVEIPGNITMGGDRIVVCSTPWTRYPLPEEPSAADVPQP